MKEFISKLSIKQYLQFITVGGLGVIINLTLLFMLTEFLGIFYIFSEMIAFLIATIHNYFLNKVWTFKEKFRENSVQKLIQYLTVSLFGLMINLSILFIVVEFFGIWYIISELFGTGASSFLNFYGNKYWTFKIEEE